MGNWAKIGYSNLTRDRQNDQSADGEYLKHFLWKLILFHFATEGKVNLMKEKTFFEGRS